MCSMESLLQVYKEILFAAGRARNHHRHSKNATSACFHVRKLTKEAKPSRVMSPQALKLVVIILVFILILIVAHRRGAALRAVDRRDDRRDNVLDLFLLLLVLLRVRLLVLVEPLDALFDGISNGLGILLG